MDMAINMESVKLGKTQNHLLFKGYVPCFDNNRKFEFDFTGVDLSSTSSMLEKQLNRLRQELVKDFGYPPFDEKAAKEILGNGKQYRVKI